MKEVFMAQETTAQPNTTTTATDLASYQQFALEQQAQNNAWSAEQAKTQMDFQKEMSNTAHQREVADLKAAGLNPILSVNSGASVPNGAAGDTDTSAAGNVGGILQQVLQAQSAREVAGMYNAATLAAASIAANASMYGSDMAYWNAEDHPSSEGEVAARVLLTLMGGGSHGPGSGSSPHDNNGNSSTSSSSSNVSPYKSGSMLDSIKHLFTDTKYRFTWTRSDFDKMLSNPVVQNAARGSRASYGAIFSTTGKARFYSWLKSKAPNIRLTPSVLSSYLKLYLASPQGKAYVRAWDSRYAV